MWKSAVNMIGELRKRTGFRSDTVSLQEKEKIRFGQIIHRLAVRFMNVSADYMEQYEPSDEAWNAGYYIHPDELAAVVRSHDHKALKFHGGVKGLLRKVSVALNAGVSEKETSERRKIYGYNRYKVHSISFFEFVWKALRNLKLIVLIFCALVSLGIRIGSEGWPKGAYDGLGILLSIVLVVLVTSITDYKQSLVFKDLDWEEKNNYVEVTREGLRKKISTYDLVVGDIVHLSYGDLVPADGVFVSGYRLLIDAFRIKGVSEPMKKDEENPFLLSGTEVQEGSGKMMVTAVGMKTERGRLMEDYCEERDDASPRQVKLNDVATRTGTLGLIVDVCTFLVTMRTFLWEKSAHYPLANWTSSDALILLDIISIALTIMLITAPEGSALAMKLSLAFSMKKLMDERAFVGNAFACETMGSASCVCTDKTGILTTNHMIVSRAWVCEKFMENEDHESVNKLKSEIPEGVLGIILQCIFQNTSCKVTKDKDGHNLIVGGTPTESAILEFGMHLGGGGLSCPMYRRICDT